MHKMAPPPGKQRGPSRLLLVGAGALLLVVALMNPIVTPANCPKAPAAAHHRPSTRRAVAETAHQAALEAEADIDLDEVVDDVQDVVDDEDYPSDSSSTPAAGGAATAAAATAAAASSEAAAAAGAAAAAASGPTVAFRTSSGAGAIPEDPDFDWVAYLHNYPELLRHPISLDFTKEAAWEHYRTIGKAEGMIARRLTLRLRYHTGGQNKPGGLNNQLLCHLTAFMMAQEIGAEVVLAPALKRTAFAAEGNSWIWEDTDTLLDVDKMIAYWATRGLVVHKTPQLTGEAADEYPKLVEADEPPTKVYGDAGCLTVQLPRPYKFDNNLASVAQRARRKAVKAAEYVLRANGTIPACINLDTPRIFYRVPVSSSLNLAVSTFNEGFFLNKTLLNMATYIKRKMGWPFYGAHLRLENDASVWNGPDGEERVLDEYINIMGQANFTDTTTVYVASGLLFDGPSPEFDAVVKALKSAGVAGRIDYKEKLVDKEILKSLHSEQLALVDLLVLATSKVFVGHPWSTLSMLVEQLRICSGLGTSTIHYVVVLDETKEYLNIKMKDKFVRFAKGFTPK